MAEQPGAATAPDAPNDVGTPTESDAANAELGEAGKAALAAERGARRDAERRAREATAALKEREDAERSDLEKERARAEEAEARASSAERNLLVAQAAAKHQLPPELADALKGTTAEELDQHAKSLAKYVTHEAPDLGSGARPGTPATGSKGFSEVLRQRAKR